MEEGAPRAVAGYAQVWEADLAAGYLEERGVPAWVDEAGLDNPYPTAAGGLRLIRVFVPAERLTEAGALLVEMRLDLDLTAEESAEEAPRRPPVWVSLVGLLVVAALAVTAVPPDLRVPVGIAAAAGYLLWRFARGG